MKSKLLQTLPLLETEASLPRHLTQLRTPQHTRYDLQPPYPTTRPQIPYTPDNEISTIQATDQAGASVVQIAITPLIDENPYHDPPVSRVRKYELVSGQP